MMLNSFECKITFFSSRNQGFSSLNPPLSLFFLELSLKNLLSFLSDFFSLLSNLRTPFSFQKNQNPFPLTSSLPLKHSTPLTSLFPKRQYPSLSLHPMNIPLFPIKNASKVSSSHPKFREVMEWGLA